MTEVTIVERDSMLVVGWSAKFRSILSPDANNFEVIGDLWMKTFDYDKVSKLPGTMGHPTWGVIWQDPDDPKGLIYLAGVPFRNEPELPEGMASRKVPGGLYGKATHRGSLDGLKATMEDMHRWVDENGYTEPDNWHDLELYDERWNNSPNAEMDYFIHIQKP